ncbi:MAG: hypothetical protein ACLPID_21240 [Beijerinckiaceae bacterium]
MSKTFGEGIYSAYRQDGVLHVTVSGLTAEAQTKITLEELPFLIFPPRLGLMFETNGLASPAGLPFEIEKPFPSYPAATKVVSIADKNGLHAIDVVEKPATVSPLIISDFAEAGFGVYQQTDTEHYLIAKSDSVVPAIYSKVFGPDTYANCQGYVASQSVATPSADLIPNTLKAWIDRQPYGTTSSKLTVTVDAIVEVDWTVTLTAATPQGFNPQVKLLKLDIQLPNGPIHSNAMIRRTLRYEESPPQDDYTTVTVENGAQTLSKVVETIS